jgi:hypothetical protein
LTRIPLNSRILPLQIHEGDPICITANGKINIVDLQGKKLKRTIDTALPMIGKPLLHKNFLYTPTNDGVLKIWDTNKNMALENEVWTGRNRPLCSAVYGKYLFIGLASGSIKVYSLLVK